MKNIFNEAIIANTEEVKGGTWCFPSFSFGSYSAPAYQAPAAPVYQAPAAPAYQAPAAPVYQAPAAPVSTGTSYSSSFSFGTSFGSAANTGLSYRWNAARCCFCWC